MLHKVEKILHQRQPCEKALDRIVALCQEHLGVGGAWLMIPGKQVAIVGGGDFQRAGKRSCSARPCWRRRVHRNFDHNSVTQRGDMLWLAVHPRGQGTQGIFALTGLEAVRLQPAAPGPRRALRWLPHRLAARPALRCAHRPDVVAGIRARPGRGRRRGRLARPHGDVPGHRPVARHQRLVRPRQRRRGPADASPRCCGRCCPGTPASRVTGDNFAALLRNTSVEKRGAWASRHLRAIPRERLSCAVTRPTGRPSASASARWSGGGEDGNAALSTAQVACQAAKDRGRAPGRGL